VPDPRTDFEELCRGAVDIAELPLAGGDAALLVRVLEACTARLDDLPAAAGPGVPQLRGLLELATHLASGGPGGGPASDAGRQASLQELFDALTKLCHKINNPLTALMGRAQILQLKAGTDPNVSKAAEVIEDSGKRLAALVRELSEVVSSARQNLTG
jgi:signal transduction histidine kinase